MNFISKLFHSHKYCIVLGHREKPDGIILVTKCACGDIKEDLYSEDDPWIDEGSPRRSRFSRWSGYSWWLYDGLADDADLSLIKTRKIY